MTTNLVPVVHDDGCVGYGHDCNFRDRDGDASFSFSNSLFVVRRRLVYSDLGRRMKSQKSRIRQIGMVWYIYSRLFHYYKL